MPAYNSNAVERVAQMPDTLPLWLSVAQVAYILDIHPETVRRLVRRRVLRAALFCGAKFIHQEGVRELFAARGRREAA